MKISVAFVSLIMALASPISGAAVNHSHNHRARTPHNHHFGRNLHLQPREVKVMTVTQTVVVDQNGSPMHTSIPEMPVNAQALYVPAETTKVTSTVIEVEPTSSALPTTTSTKVLPIIKPTLPPVYTKPSPSKPPKDDDEEEDDEDVEAEGDPEREFPDGRISCKRFPAAYGARTVPWMDLGGWTGIQINGGAGDKCVDGALCSYACPLGYSKGQWPEVQPASGESHGGLECRNGKLYKTHSSNQSLCVKGHGGVYIKNEIDQSVPICRTDYPGSENMNVPLFSTSGSLKELTSPVGATFYTWRGMRTSAQYYVNQAGVPLEEGCVWGKPNGGKGNWSPMIFGAGYSEGKSWLSISQNQLNQVDKLNYNVEIVPGTPDSILNGKCKYENGHFTGGGPGERGCTAALIKGSAYFRLYQ